jgi:hypothetical protein
VETARAKLNYPWDDILLLHVEIVQARHQGDLQQAYEDQKELVQYVSVIGIKMGYMLVINTKILGPFREQSIVMTSGVCLFFMR